MSLFDPSSAQNSARWLIFSPTICQESSSLAVRLPQWWKGVHENVNNWEGIPKPKRIGYAAEQLLYRFIELAPDLELKAAGLVLRDKGITLGECDALVQSPEGFEHWEMGVKFYLYHPPSQEFIGDDGRDRLHLKLDKMLNKQLAMGHHPLMFQWCKERGFQAPSSHLMVKGCLFYPPTCPKPQGAPGLNLAPQHPSALYFVGTEGRRALEEEQGVGLHLLNRHAWLNDQWNSSEEERLLYDSCEPWPQRPFQGYKETPDGQQHRFYWVPEHWPLGP
jgi:hypothetical protein